METPKENSLSALLGLLETATTPAEIKEVEKRIQELEGNGQTEEEYWRDRIYHDIPQKDFAAMCGETPDHPRQTKQLQDMERNWGLPFAGETLDLFEFFPKLWKFLVQWGPLLSVVMEDESGEVSQTSLGVRFLKARIAKAEEDARATAIRNDLRQNTLIERARIHEVFERLVNVVRRMSDRAQSRWGQEGFDFVAGLIDGFEDEIRGVKNEIADASIEAVAVATDECSGVVQPRT